MNFTYRRWVGAGILLGFAWALVSSWLAGLSLLVCALLLSASLAACASYALARKAVLQREAYTLYHYLLASLAAAAGLLWILGLSDLRYLDMTSIALAIAQGVGRVGCHAVGCCHGRPSGWGVRYGQAHAGSGFPRWLVGVPLLPVQAVESAWSLSLGVGCTVLLLGGASPGSALVTYLIAYGTFRFFIEFARGDRRPFALGFSEPQWTSWLLMSATVAGEWAGLLPFHPWHALSLLLASIAIVSLGVARSLRDFPRHQLVGPVHLQELGETLEALKPLPAVPIRSGADTVNPDIEVAQTSLGLRISAGRLAQEGGETPHYSISGRDRKLTPRAVRTIADLILQLAHPGMTHEILTGRGGVFHVVVKPSAPEPNPSRASSFPKERHYAV